MGEEFSLVSSKACIEEKIEWQKFDQRALFPPERKPGKSVKRRTNETSRVDNSLNDTNADTIVSRTKRNSFPRGKQGGSRLERVAPSRVKPVYK